MLILTRRIGEWIKIGDDIGIRVMDINSNYVQLGFDAPRHIPIHRGEVYERNKSKKRIHSFFVRFKESITRRRQLKKRASGFIGIISQH